MVSVREQGLAASRGATDFSEYFLYFSFFLVVSALMLTTLFFKLGIEQRAREVGTLQAIGFRNAAIRRLFLAEGTLLAVAGSLLGLAGAVGYAALLMACLTWWVDGRYWYVVDFAYFLDVDGDRCSGGNHCCCCLYFLHVKKAGTRFDAVC